jgi:Zn-dependent peptidase ImmA (M78 family)
MIPGWLADAANRFWSAAGAPPPFPRDLDEVVSFALPVYQVVMPRLRLASVEERLRHHGFALRFDEEDRRLAGAVVAHGGYGFLFVDGADAPDERRFTLAHEIAHFVLDYQFPRDRAIALLGEGIVPVLDGLRPPTRTERIDAVLAACATGLHVYLLDRLDPSGRVVTVEDRADRLACELLAPDDELRRRFGEDPPEASALAAELVGAFGLPVSVARAYADRWLAPRRPPTFLRGLGR